MGPIETFHGWGGEDDDLQLHLDHIRIKDVDLPYYRIAEVAVADPEPGATVDLPRLVIRLGDGEVFQVPLPAEEAERARGLIQVPEARREAFEDVLWRLAGEPRTGRGSGARPLKWPLPGFAALTTVDRLRRELHDGPGTGVAFSTDVVELPLLSGSLDLAAWQVYAELGRTLVRAAGDATLDTRIAGLPAQPVGGHRDQAFTDDEELTLLAGLLDLLPLSAETRAQAVAMFAFAGWASAPEQVQPTRPRPWLVLEHEWLPDLTGDPTEQPTTVPTATRRQEILGAITVALAADGDLTGELAPLWNRFGPALGEIAAANLDLWNRSLRRDRSLWRLAQVRRAARELIDNAGWLATVTLVDQLDAVAKGETDRYGLSPGQERTTDHTDEVAALAEAAEHLADLYRAMDWLAKNGDDTGATHRKAREAVDAILAHYPVLRTLPAMFVRTNPGMSQWAALLAFAVTAEDEQLPMLRHAITALRTAAVRARALLDGGRLHPLDLPAAVHAASAGG